MAINTVEPSQQGKIAILTEKIADKRDEFQLQNVIKELQERWIPSEEFVGITDFGWLHERFDGHWRTEYWCVFSKFVEEFMSRPPEPSLYRNVLDNIKITKQRGPRILQNTYSDKVYRALVIENTTSDPIYNVFWLLQDAIVENRWMIRGVTEEIKDMWEGLAINFVEMWKSQFLWRISFSDQQFWDNVISELSMEEQYNTLSRIAWVDKKTQREILRRICEIFPSYHGASFSWIWMKLIVDELSPVVENNVDAPISRQPLSRTDLIIRAIFSSR